MKSFVDAFPPTRWSMVLSARSDPTAEDAQKALEELCRVYWRPLYSYARRIGNDPADAEDLTQGFFSVLLKEDIFSSADESLGKLRSFLIGAFNHHMSRVHRHDHTMKRGGDRIIVSLEEAAEAERSYQMNSAHDITPELLYEQRCAIEFIQAALRTLGAEQTKAGRGDTFHVLLPHLDPTSGKEENQAQIAQELGISHESVRTTLHRLRVRFRKILRKLVADTLREPSPESVDEELRAMLSALTEPDTESSSSPVTL